jgi:hypothetical protein
MLDACVKIGYAALRRDGWTAQAALRHAKLDAELSELESDEHVRFVWDWEDTPYDGDDPDGSIESLIDSGELDGRWVRMQVSTDEGETWADASDVLPHHGRYGFISAAFVKQHNGEHVPAFDAEGKRLYSFTPSISDSLGGVWAYTDRRGDVHRREVELDLASSAGLIGTDALNAPRPRVPTR